MARKSLSPPFCNQIVAIEAARAASNGSILNNSMDENRQHHGGTEDVDAAPVPFFDDEATQVAQPVVPLTPEAAAVAASPPSLTAPREEVLTVVSSQTSAARFHGV